MKIAAVDVGSNAIRVSIAHADMHAKTYTLVHEERHALRLGADVFNTGFLSETTLQAMTSCFLSIKALLKKHGVVRTYAVATSAMREARNRDEAVERIFNITGLLLHIIEGVEEARLGRLALKSLADMLGNDVLLMDLGGGSLEISRGFDKPGVSFPLGSVRLLQKYPELKQAMSLENYRTIFESIDQTLREQMHAHFDTTGVMQGVGMGGSFRYLGRALGTVVGTVPTVECSKISVFTQSFCSVSYDERIKNYGLRADQADVMAPALAVIVSICDIFKLNVLLVPDTGLRQGLLYDLLERGF